MSQKQSSELESKSETNEDVSLSIIDSQTNKKRCRICGVPLTCRFCGVDVIKKMTLKQRLILLAISLAVLITCELTQQTAIIKVVANALKQFVVSTDPSDLDTLIPIDVGANDVNSEMSESQQAETTALHSSPSSESE